MTTVPFFVLLLVDSYLQLGQDEVLTYLEDGILIFFVCLAANSFNCGMSAFADQIF
jgi:hypothetical protein